MKKIYTLTGVLALIGTGVFAQSAKSSFGNMMSTLTPAAASQPSAASSSSAPGDTIKYVDFSNAADYSISSIADNPSSAEWKVGAVPANIVQYSGDPESPTKANGYAYCEGISVLLAGTAFNPIDTRIMLTTPINTTTAAAKLSYYQNYRAFNSDQCFIEFSLDGVAWTKSIEVNTEAVGNGANVEGDRSMLFPAEFQGKPAVYVSFRWTAPNTPQFGGGYGWQVDDVAITEAPSKDLVIVKTFLDGGRADQQFYSEQFPIKQTHMLSPFVVVKNNGGLAQDVVLTITVEKDGNVFTSFTSPATNIASGVTDTIYMDTYKPEIAGEYLVTYTVAGSTPGDDANEDDNTDFDPFYVTGREWGGDHNTQDWSRSGFAAFHEGNSAAAPYAGVTAGQAFQAYGNDKVESLTTVFFNTNTSKTTVGQSVYIELFRFNDPDNYTAGFSTSELTSLGNFEYVVLETDTFAQAGDIIYTTIKFDAPIDITPGVYIAGVTSLGGTNIFNIPNYSGNAQYDNSGCIRGNIQASGTSESTYAIYSNVNPFIKMNVVETTGITNNEKALNFSLGQNSPNPASSSTVISYSLKSAGSASLSIVDITGKTVVSENFGSKAAGNYTYGVNAGNFNAGIYFYTLTVDGQSITKKMVISE